MIFKEKGICVKGYLFFLNHGKTIIIMLLFFFSASCVLLLSYLIYKGFISMKKKTKIVATISNKNCDTDFIEQLYQAGMDVVRLNTAHQDHDDALKVIHSVRSVSEKIAILIDTKGPEIRTTESESEIKVEYGDTVYIKGAPDEKTTPDCICVTYDKFVHDIPVFSRILIDDGEIELLVTSKTDEKLTCEVKNQGYILGRKSINIPSVHIKLPALSEKDKGFIRFAARNDVDFIAHY